MRNPSRLRTSAHPPRLEPERRDRPDLLDEADLLVLVERGQLHLEFGLLDRFGWRGGRPAAPAPSSPSSAAERGRLCRSQLRESHAILVKETSA